MEEAILEISEEEEIKEKYIFKIVIIGDSGVGKSNIITRYVKNEFNLDTKTTIGIEFMTKLFKIDNEYIKIHLWDTAGQEKFKSITTTYYKGAKGAVIVFDITRRETFENVENWVQQVKMYSDKDISIIIVGNKTDLSHLRSVAGRGALEKIEQISNTNKINVVYIETSAMSNNNINEAFSILIKGDIN